MSSIIASTIGDSSSAHVLRFNFLLDRRIRIHFICCRMYLEASKIDPCQVRAGVEGASSQVKRHTIVTNRKDPDRKLVMWVMAFATCTCRYCSICLFAVLKIND